jgi:hypothetical protein
MRHQKEVSTIFDVGPLFPAFELCRVRGMCNKGLFRQLPYSKGYFERVLFLSTALPVAGLRHRESIFMVCSRALISAALGLSSPSEWETLVREGWKLGTLMVRRIPS